MTERLTGPSGRPVELGILRAGSSTTERISVVRETIQIPTVVGMQRNPDQTWNYWLDAANNLGYLRITHFTKHTPEELQLAMDTLMMSELKGVVVDLR